MNETKEQLGDEVRVKILGEDEGKVMLERIGYVGIKNIDYKSEYWLYDQYWNKKQTMRQVAELCEVCEHVIWYWMSKFGIVRRKPGTSLEKGESNFNAFYKRYKWSAKENNLKFNLTKEEFKGIIEQDCFYCGALPDTPHSHDKSSYGDYYSNGIDRIDSSIGYVRDNSRPCCIKCNRAKHAMSEDEFRLLIRNIYKHFILGGKNATQGI